MDFDNMLLTRHIACHLTDEVPEEKISQSSPEVMAQLRAVFHDYKYSSSTLFGELIDRVSAYLYAEDPLGIIDPKVASQSDEYDPEASMVLWLHFTQNLSPHTFWAIWEYQFADLNPYSTKEDVNLGRIFDQITKILEQ
jgi:hypothetical protein